MITLEALRSIPDFIFIVGLTVITWFILKVYVTVLSDPDYKPVPIFFSVFVFLFMVAAKFFL
jgi:hypothetical protein